MNQINSFEQLKEWIFQNDILNIDEIDQGKQTKLQN